MNTVLAKVEHIIKDTYDLSRDSIRELNQALHNPNMVAEVQDWTVKNPGGQHNIAVGIKAPINVTIDGHAGYYCAGMNQEADIVVNGNVGVGVAENMMSGSVHIKGNASQAAGATAHGGRTQCASGLEVRYRQLGVTQIRGTIMQNVMATW